MELFIGKFIPNINNENAQNYSCPGATFAFCSDGEKLPRQGGLPSVLQWVTCLSKLLRGNEKLMCYVTGVRPCTEAKLTPGVSELHRGNELSRDLQGISLILNKLSCNREISGDLPFAHCVVLGSVVLSFRNLSNYEMTTRQQHITMNNKEIPH